VVVGDGLPLLNTAEGARLSYEAHLRRVFNGGDHMEAGTSATCQWPLTKRKCEKAPKKLLELEKGIINFRSWFFLLFLHFAFSLFSFYE